MQKVPHEFVEVLHHREVSKPILRQSRQWVAEFLHEEFQCHLSTLNIIKLNTWKLLEVFNQLPVVLQQVLLVKSLPRLWIRVNQPLSKCISVFFQLKLSSVSGCSCSSMPGQGLNPYCWWHPDVFNFFQIWRLNIYWIYWLHPVVSVISSYLPAKSSCSPGTWDPWARLEVEDTLLVMAYPTQWLVKVNMIGYPQMGDNIIPDMTTNNSQLYGNNSHYWLFHTQTNFA